MATVTIDAFPATGPGLRGPGPARPGPATADRSPAGVRPGGPSGPGRCWSWPPRPRPRCSPGVGPLQGERSYSGARAYNQSKLVNVLFTYELARKLQATLVTANTLHPGVVRTSFGAEDPGGVQRLLIPFMRPFMNGSGRGAATSIHLASAPDLEQVTGRYFASSKPRRSSRRSYDQAAAARL